MTLRAISSVSQVLEAVPGLSIYQIGNPASCCQFRPNLHGEHGAECVITELHKQPELGCFQTSSSVLHRTQADTFPQGCEVWLREAVGLGGGWAGP